MSILDTNLIETIDKSIPISFQLYGLPTDHYLVKVFLECVAKRKKQYNVGNWCMQALRQLLSDAAFEAMCTSNIHINEYPQVNLNIISHADGWYGERIWDHRPDELEIEISNIFPFTFYITPIPPYHTDFKDSKRVQIINDPDPYRY